jgi:hypothetical protein
MPIKGEGLARAFWAFDRALGGERPPTRVKMFAARRPLVVGLVTGLFFGGTYLISPEGGTDVAAGGIAGVLTGAWFAMFARIERARQRRLVRLGVWDGVHARSVGRAEAMDERRLDEGNRPSGPAGNGPRA